MRNAKSENHRTLCVLRDKPELSKYIKVLCASTKYMAKMA